MIRGIYLVDEWERRVGEVRFDSGVQITGRLGGGTVL